VARTPMVTSTVVGAVHSPKRRLFGNIDCAQRPAPNAGATAGLPDSIRENPFLKAFWMRCAFGEWYGPGNQLAATMTIQRSPVDRAVAGSLARWTS